MSITPSTIDSAAVPYTVVGGFGSERGDNPRWPVTVVILNRAGRFNRLQLVEQLARYDFSEILCIESGSVNMDIEQQCRAHPRLRFMLLGEERDTGTCLNLAIVEARSPYVLVLWSDLSLMPFIDHAFADILQQKVLCTVPLVRSPRGEVVPSLAMPAEQRNSLKIIHAVPSQTHQASLYPFDYLGIYHRELFIQSQGFDQNICNPFWQKMDFGYRAWLWGNRIEGSTDIRLQSSLDLLSEDSTPDGDYARFYLKNLLPRFTGDQAGLPAGRFFAFRRVSSRGIFSAWKEFQVIREWVADNAYRFKHDARYIAELWETGRGVS